MPENQEIPNTYIHPGLQRGLELEREEGQRERALLLNPEQHEILRLTALGLDYKQIAIQRGWARSTIKNKASEINGQLRVDNLTESVIVAAKAGVLHPLEMVPEGYDLRRFLDLSQGELAIISTVVAKQAATYRKLATSFPNWSEATVKNYIHSVYQKLNVPSMSQAAILYLAFEPQAERLKEEVSKEREVAQAEAPLLNERQREILRLSGMGMSEKEISNRLGYSALTIRNNVTPILKILGVQNQTQAVLVALDKGELTLDEMIPEEFDFKVFLKLTGNQRALLDVLTQKDQTGAYLAQTSDIADFLNIARSSVKNRLSAIYSELGLYSRTQAAVLWLAFKEREQALREEALREEASHNPLTDKQQEMLVLVGKGLSNKEIAQQLGFAQSTIKNAISQMFRVLGVGSRREAIVSAIERGDLLPEELLSEDIDLSLVDTLPESYKGVLQKLAENNGKNKKRDIAAQLGYADETVKNKLSVIYAHLGVRDSTMAAVVFLASQKPSPPTY